MIFKLNLVLTTKNRDLTSFAIIVKPRSFIQYPWVQVSFGGLLFLLGLYQFLRRRSDARNAKRLKQQLIETELDRLKLRQSFLLNQANPHFTFNILNAFEGLISQNKLREAQRYIGMFGDIFRSVLYDDKKLSRSLEEELDFVGNYLELEKLRFPKKFDYEIIVDEQVSPKVFVPKMMIQTFVNNAIKHGFEPLKSGGKLRVHVKLKNDYLIISY